MQIHELNGFNGNLNNETFLAVDDGNDTGKVSVPALLSDVSAQVEEIDNRVDNIIAGTAPSAAEIVDARVGADGVTYQTLGAAIRDQDSNLQKNVEYISDAIVSDATLLRVNLAFQRGWTSSTGEVTDSENTFVTRELLETKLVEYCEITDDSLLAYIKYYDENGVFQSSATLTKATGKYYLDSSYPNFRAQLAYLTIQGQLPESFLEYFEFYREITKPVDQELRDLIYAELGLVDVNFFDKSQPTINAYINGSSVITANNSNRLAWVKLMPNVTYRLTIEEKADTDFQFILCNTEPAAGVTGIGKYTAPANSESIDYIFTTTDEYYYAAFKYYATSATTRTEEQVLDSISVKLRATALEDVKSEPLDPIDWIHGGIEASDGRLTYSSQTNYITPDYLSEKVLSVEPQDGYYIAIFAYSRGEYVGCYVGSQTSADGSFEKTYNIKRVKIDIDDLRNKYPYYQFRLLAGKLDAPYTNVIENIIFETSSSFTEEDLSVNEVVSAMEQARYIRGTSGSPLTLLQFSDIHGNEDRLRDIVDYMRRYSPYINEAICTGDMVMGQFPDGMAFWDNVEGSEYILTCIGNHDAVTAQTGGSLVDMATLCSAFITPYISNWGTVNHPADKTYYYKDYPNSGIRLIVLDCMNVTTDQITWLEAALTSANTNDLHVIIAIHYPSYPRDIVNCDFSPATDLHNYDEATIPAEVINAVDSFQNNGGVFACYITGHEHQDAILTVDGKPNQLVINITCATNTNEQVRMSDQYRYGDASNAINLITFNSNEGTVSIKRVGADMDMFLRPRKTFSYSYADHKLLK